MKKLLINFLFKKRFKILKSKKGFSLLEVLVAVGIIAIISAIAVPQYTANRENAARVAGDTSIGNIEKAYKHCVALGSAGDCSSLTALKVTCPDCSSTTDGNTPVEKWCAQIQKTAGGKTFRACIDFDDGDTVGRAYGGSMFKDIKLCHTEVKSCTATANNKAKAAQKGAIECTSTNAVQKCGAASTTDATTNCVTEHTCAAINVAKGVCASGVCSR